MQSEEEKAKIEMVKSLMDRAMLDLEELMLRVEWEYWCKVCEELQPKPKEG